MMSYKVLVAGSDLQLHYSVLSVERALTFDDSQDFLLYSHYYDSDYVVIHSLFFHYQYQETLLQDVSRVLYTQYGVLEDLQHTSL